MHKITYLLLLFPLGLLAQLPQNAPWNNENSANTKSSELNFIQYVEKGDTYFQNIDIKKKGSGYKPFKRWEDHWKSYLTQDGYIAPASNLWNAWVEKNNLQNSAKTTSEIISSWESLGPYNFIDSGSWGAGQGRVNCVAVDPNNSNVYYVGAPAGGLWKSINAGISWIPLTDHLPQIGVSGIAINKNNSNIIYITTGDDDAGDSYFVGVMKSIDGGITWTPTGSIGGNSANEIYIDPSNSKIVWVATSVGLYKSIDSGSTWSLKQSGNIKDFKLKPGVSNTVYAVTSNSFYKSTNGETFTKVTSGLPVSSSRLTIDVSPANPDIVYVLSANANSNYSFQGLYKSFDSGSTFTKTPETKDIFDGSSQAWFDLALCVSSIDANIVFVGNLNIWKSTSGGNSFTRINQWNDDAGVAYTHADIHFLRYFNGVLFSGTDGGIYRSINNGQTFESLTTGLAIGQFYRIGVSKQSSQHIVGGLQDNGGYAFSNNTWYNYHGADGMDAVANPTKKNQYFSFVQNGSALYKTEDGGVSSNFVALAPDNKSGEWVTPLVMDTGGALYAGYDELYKLVNNSWVQVSNNLFASNLQVIEVNPQDNNIIYVSTGLNLYKSIDAGVTFTQVTASFLGTSISSIEINNHNGNIVYLTTNGVLGKVYKSSDGGTTWTNISGNLPFEAKNVVRHQKYNVNNPIYVGTALGVYYIDDTLTSWEPFYSGLPNVEITDLEITEIDSKITASTYGRGIWQSSIPNNLPASDVTLVEILNPIQISCSSSNPVIKVKNTGNNAISQIQIDYKIDKDNLSYVWNGTLNSLSVGEIELPVNGITKGKHNLSVTINTQDDFYSDNNQQQVEFYINEVNENPLEINSFESVAEAWNIYTEGPDDINLWQMSAPQSGSTKLTAVSTGTQAYITNPSGNYSNNTISDLYTDCYNLSAIENPVMKFKMAFDIEENWDVLYVQYSADGGLTWQVLGTADDPNWYNNNYTDNDLTIGKQWSGTNLILQEYSYDLAALNNETQVIFRFHFASDQYENGEGVLIDDFVISGALANEDVEFSNLISMYPNPTEEFVMVKWPHSEKSVMKVYDITGKMIMEHNVAAFSEESYSLKGLSKGLYIVNFITDRNSVSKKLVIR